MEPEIITRTEAGGKFPQASEAEPALTLSQLQSLLRAAADLERAQRPIVLHTAQQPATAPHTAPAGASMFVPMPPAAPAVQAPQQPSEFNPWPLVFSVSMAGVLGSAGAAAATGSSIAVLGVFGFASAWCLSVYQIVFNHREA